MTDEEKTKAVRVQRRRVDRRRDDAIAAMRAFLSGDGRSLRADMVDALSDLDDAERHLAELSGNGQTPLVYQPATHGPMVEDDLSVDGRRHGGGEP